MWRSGRELSVGRPSAATRRLRWIARVYGVVAIGLVPWVVALGVSLPGTRTSPHSAAAWVGLDVFELIFIAATSWLAHRRDARYGLTAAVAAALCFIDAWFDVLTSPSGWQRQEAVLLAVVVEVPFALLSGWLALHAERTVAADALARLPRPVPPTAEPARPDLARESTEPQVANRPLGQVRGAQTRA